MSKESEHEHEKTNSILQCYQRSSSIEQPSIDSSRDVCSKFNVRG